MERRDNKRIVIGLIAGIRYKDRNYEGVIENLSDSGVNVITTPTEDAPDFVKGERIELEFQPHTGETLTLSCRIKWVKKAAPHSERFSLGMEILDPPWDQSVFFI
jgi:hypothetical protein